MIDPPHSLRLRVFAGPNGSGKSTVIHSVKHLIINDRPIDFGIYVNADDIAQNLRRGNLSFEDYGLQHCNSDRFLQIAIDSGLIFGLFDGYGLQDTISIKENQLTLLNEVYVEQIAQIIAEFLRVELLAQHRKFSFETVFSHPSKVQFMKTCAEQGYKVYFYFVGTESPEINRFRVNSRVNLGGHAVPPSKIEDRYYRSMDLMWEAAQHCYQGFFFDNSVNDQPWNLFAQFKKAPSGEKSWKSKNIEDFPQWFMKYYVQKAHQNEEL